MLVTYQDGTVSKLLLDENGYLYPYVTKNSTELKFQITDEKGTANFGNYELIYDPITGDDNSSNEPVVSIPPKVITFSPYANASIEYSFDRVNWASANTDSNCQFNVVFPEGVNKIYLKYNGLMFGIDLDDSGNPGVVVELKPTIMSQSGGNVSLLQGKEGSIYVNAQPVNTGSALKYQWYKDGSPIPNEIFNTLTFLDPSNLDDGVYTCSITEDGVGNKLSSPISIIVTVGQVIPELKILAQSSNKTVIKGYSTDLYVLAQPDTTTYEWYKDGDLIPGVSGYQMTVTGTATGAAIYTCVVKNGEDSVISQPMIVDIVDNPLESELVDLGEIKNNLEEQVNNISGQLASLQSEKANLESLIITLNEQITGLNNQIETLQGQLLKAQEDLQAAGADKELLNQQIQLLNNQITNLTSTIDSLYQDVQEANNQKNILQQEISDLNIQVTNLNNQITLLNQKVSEKEAENNELKSQIILLQDQVLNMQTEISNLQNTVISLTEQNNTLIVQVQQLQNDKQSLEVIINELQQQLVDANTTIENLTNQVTTLTTQLSTVTAEKNVLEVNVTDLNNQVINLNSQITVLQEKVSDLQAQLDLSGQGTTELLQQITNLNNQVINLNQAVSEKQELIEQLTLEKSLLQTTVTNLENQIVILQEKITLLQGTITDQQNEITSLNNQLSNLQENVTTLQNELNNLQQTKDDIEDQLNNARIEINNLKSTILLIKAELGVTDDSEILPAIRNLKDQLTQQSNANVLLTNQINIINQQLVDAQQSNNDMQQKLQELMELLTADNQDDIKVKIIELQTDLVNSQNQILQLTEEKSNLIQQLDDANVLIKDLQKQIQDLLDISGQDYQELLKQIKDLNDQISTLVQQNSTLQTQINDLSAKVIELNQDKISYQSEIVRLQTLLETANSSLIEVREQLANAEAENTTLKAENENLKKEIEELKKQLLSGGGSIPNVPQTPSNDKEVTELKNKLEKAIADLEEAKAILAETQKLLEEEKNKTVNAVPDNAVVVMPAEETLLPTAIKELSSTKGSVINTEYITAEKGWEVAKDLTSTWQNKLKLSDLTGTSTRPELIKISFYARKKSAPQKVYEYAVNAEKPITATVSPNFTMNKLIYLGSEFKINLSVPEGAKVSYNSSNKKVANVSKDGKIKPIKEGKVIITGSVKGIERPYNFSINVTVSAEDKKTLNLKNESILSSSSNPVLEVYKLVAEGEKTKISLTGSKDAAITYISSDPSVIAVSPDGTLKGIDKGYATVTAILSQDGTIYTYVIRVRVTDGTADKEMWNYLTVA